jgi:UTP--glucose-1-phosphate uridylyltransferase
VTQTVRKAVIPAAGLGTRFLPATKSQPKEMLLIVDKPAIQYAVEEAVRVGLTDILIVTGRGKTAIEDHFDRDPALEQYLEDAGKHELLESVRGVSELADVHYVRQRDPLGLGHAVSVARDHVGSEPFAVLLPDDVMVDDSRLLRSMVEVYERHGSSVLALQRMPGDEIARYGAVEPEHVEDGLVRVLSIVEKPPPAAAPSDLAALGRYVFTAGIFDALAEITPGAGGELQLTDAIGLLLKSQTVFGRVFEHGRVDAGQPLELLRANVELALERSDLAPEFGAFLVDIVRRRGLT